MAKPAKSTCPPYRFSNRNLAEYNTQRFIESTNSNFKRPTSAPYLLGRQGKAIEFLVSEYKAQQEINALLNFLSRNSRLNSTIDSVLSIWWDNFDMYTPLNAPSSLIDRKMAITNYAITRMGLNSVDRQTKVVDFLRDYAFREVFGKSPVYAPKEEVVA